ncbi:MAG TPA: sensor domain-containing diguanylate cyclase [Gaiellaceae bacterium]|nr:sensor domain-containing diguanylate cyclase [Gaiellaceae bacterium]
MVLALAVLPLPPYGERLGVVFLAVALSAMIVSTVAFVPWAQLPRFAETVPPLAYFVVIALLRESEGGSVSGYSALAMLPVFWLALYGTRSQLAIGIAGVASMFLAPLLLLGPPDYPPTEWRRALLWICVAPIVGYTVQGLVAELRDRAEAAARSEDETRRMLAYMASVTAVTRRMAGSADPVAVRAAVCSSALAISGADFAQLIEPDDDGVLVRRAAAGADVEIDGCEPSFAAEAYTTRRPLFVADRTRSLLFEPVLRDDDVVGVLVLGWRSPPGELGEAAESGLRMLAAEAAIAIHRAELLARLETSARTDDLTGLPNRRAWEHELPRELARAKRERRSVCVAMLDLDCFKRFNDERGHQAGDRLLKQATAAWCSQLRSSDMLARYGGEEFALLLPGCTLSDAEPLLERLRVVMPEAQTVSAGVACWDGSESTEELVGRADAALYEAKREGRDRLITSVV